MYKLSKFIVEKRNLFIILFMSLCILSAFAAQKVQINYDMTKYLPTNSETKIALNVMQEQFGSNGVANVIIANITPAQAMDLKNEISQIGGVLDASFENSTDYYKEGNALIKITFTEGDYSSLTRNAIYDIRAKLTNYQIEMSGSSVHAVDQLDDVEKQMTIILAICIPIILLILFFNANSYAEILVFGIVVGSSVLINKGTNIFLGEISYVTNSIAIVLQLALAMDYSIILLHRFQEEKKNYDDKNAIIHALKNSIKSISSSSLTTIVGMIAIMFMQYSIGFDIGIVLAKSIVCSLFSVFFLMPGVLLLFSNLIEKTKHKNFIPKMTTINQYIIKTRRFMPIIMVSIVISAFTIQLHNTYDFNFNTNENSNYIDLFGKTNTLAIIVPNGNNEEEKQVVNLVEASPYVNSAMGITTLGIKDNLNVLAFSQKAKIDMKTANGIYASYAQSIGGVNGEINFNQMIEFMKDNVSSIGLTDLQMTNIDRISSLLNVNGKDVSYQTFANMLGLSENDAYMIYMIFEMSLNEQTYQLNTMINYMFNNSEALGLTADEINQIGQTKGLLDEKDESINYQTFADLLGMNEDDALKIYTLYEMSLNSPVYGISDLIEFMNTNQASLGLNEEEIISINQSLNLINNKNIALNANNFGQLIGLDITESNNLFLMYNNVNSTNDSEIKEEELVSFMFENKKELQLSDAQVLVLNQVYALLNNTEMNTETFANMLNMPFSQANGIYAYYATSLEYQTSSVKLNDIITFIYNNQDLLNLDANQLLHVQTLKQLFENSNTNFNSGEFAMFLGIDQNSSTGIYAYYSASLGKEVPSINFNTMVNYMLTNPQLLGLSESQISQIGQIKAVIDTGNSSLTSQTFSDIMQMNLQDTNLLYFMYHININQQTYMFLDIINYMYENSNDLGMNEIQLQQLTQTKEQIDKAITNFENDNYTRIIFNINLDSDDNEALKLIENLRIDLKNNYSEYYVLGDSANILDVKDSFNHDVLYVNFITIISVLMILIFTFRSFILPVILVLVIQGSVWINFALSTIFHSPILFIGYIIVTAIQMGATIDYAIIVTSRYKEFRKELNKFDAIKEAIQASIPTILTSGGILIVAGFSVGLVSTVPATASLGMLIGRGALISCLLVIFLLPQLLLIFDKIFFKEASSKKEI